MKLKETMKGIIKELKIYISNLAAYTKYQIITKGILLVLIYLLFNVIGGMLIKSSGHLVLSSGNYKDILFSVRGIGFIIISLVLFLLTVAIDINAFIAISSSIKITGKPIKISEAIIKGIKSIKSLASPAGLFLMFFTLLIVPLASVGLKTSLFKGLKIPNFITSVIYNNPMYSTLYGILIFIFGVAGFFLIMSFHYMYLCKKNSIDSIKLSIKTVWKHKFKIVENLVLLNGSLFILTAIALFIIYMVVEYIDYELVGNLLASRFIMMNSLLTFEELMNIWFFLIAPLQIHMLTSRFFATADLDGFEENVIKGNDKIAKPKKKFNYKVVIILVVIFNILVSGFSAIFFDEMFRYRSDIDIVAHRGGGNLGAENTIKGLNAAIDAGSQWSEIDVMRSKDGTYIINHDNDFSRLAGVSKKPSEMTWEEIKKLKIKDEFDSSREDGSVPDLDSIMNAAKGKIGLFIELKGSDADKKMADHVVKAILEKNMRNNSVIISLDYNLIKYIEEKYPEIYTGYLYFFSLGDPSKINTDYLIMEESAVNMTAIENIHREGKKAYVWTVNNSESINTLFEADVDGIITDQIVDIKESIKRWDKKTDKDIILDEIIGIIKSKSIL